MSRNARTFTRRLTALRHFAAVTVSCGVLVSLRSATEPPSKDAPKPGPSRVVIVHDAGATDAFKPIPERIGPMVSKGIQKLTGQTTVAGAWQSLVSARDVVGLKVVSSPGADAGTRPAVVAAVVEGLLEAGISKTNVVIWDKQRADLRQAGFVDIAEKYGVLINGSANAGYDEATFYSPERPILGQLVWGDVEFGKKDEGVGRRSFVTKLLSQQITKIINITPMLNHNTAGVSGHLYSLSMGSVDNTIRFENDLFRLSTAVPEIYALPSLSDRVVLNITDALICQYQGEQRGLLHYSAALNELRFSKDPVALDFLSLRELERTREASKIPISRTHSISNHMELLHNATLLELGTCDLQSIRIERMP